MGTLTQAAPFSDSVPQGDSEGYQNLLQVSGASGAVTYTTVAPSAGLLVEPNGSVFTTGDLQPGVYTLAGTCEDTASNTGSWLFSLTVTTLVQPQTSVTPVTSSNIPTANGMEISVPFRIDPATGGVAIVTDYAAIIAQHIESILLTGFNERLMLLGYGSSLETAVFAPINTPLTAFLASDLKRAINQWEPAANVIKVSITNDANTPEVLNITVVYSVLPYNAVNTLTVSTGGIIQQASS